MTTVTITMTNITPCGVVRLLVSVCLYVANTNNNNNKNDNNSSNNNDKHNNILFVGCGFLCVVVGCRLFGLVVWLLFVCWLVVWLLFVC